jgi:hypothetical protein
VVSLSSVGGNRSGSRLKTWPHSSIVAFALASVVFALASTEPFATAGTGWRAGAPEEPDRARPTGPVRTVFTGRTPSGTAWVAFRYRTEGGHECVDIGADGSAARTAGGCFDPQTPAPQWGLVRFPTGEYVAVVYLPDTWRPTTRRVFIESGDQRLISLAQSGRIAAGSAPGRPIAIRVDREGRAPERLTIPPAALPPG